jgi:hypothetical protein
MEEKPKPKRRWFRYSLRTLLLLVTVISVGFGWLGIKVRQAQRQKEAVETIRKSNCFVAYDYQIDSHDFYDSRETPPGPVWLHKLFGIDFFGNVDCVFWRKSEIADADLVRLKEFTHLRFLHLDHPEIVDADLVHVQAFAKLKSLNLDKTQITDAGLAKLQSLTQLERLCLSETQVTDAGLAKLQALTKLKYVQLQNTQVTDAGCDELKKSLPNLTINR